MKCRILLPFLFLSILLNSCKSSYIADASEYFIVVRKNPSDTTIDIRTLINLSLPNGKTKTKLGAREQRIFFFPDIVKEGDTVFVGDNYQGKHTLKSYSKISRSTDIFKSSNLK